MKQNLYRSQWMGVLLLMAMVLVSCVPAVVTAPATENAASPAPAQTNVENSGAGLPLDGDPAQASSLTIDTLNRVPPQDIIEEIAFFGGLGGGSDLCSDFDFPSPTFLYMDEYPHEWMDPVDFTVCAIPLPADVHFRLERPDGGIEESSLPARQTPGKNTGEVDFEYVPGVFSAVGEHQVIVAAPGWELTYPFTVVEPSDATVYSDASHVFLVNFAPNEAVRLFVYGTGGQGNAKLIGWNEFHVDQDGDLTIASDLSATGYAAIGEITGQRSVGLDDVEISCPGSRAPSGVAPLGYAEVRVDDPPTYKYDSGQGQWVRSEASNIKRGSIVQINSNAICVDGTFVWYVFCLDDSCTSEYIADSGPDGYYLQPASSPPPAGTADAANIPACPGTQPTRLNVGSNAEVTTSGMAPQLSLRAQPSMGAEQAHVIAAGRDLVILDGPVCAENSYWWYIRSEQGFEGWAREGDQEDYWIDPLP